ncbi:MAG: class I SAM-dependent methyltransferase, partial [Actinomadura sp.]
MIVDFRPHTRLRGEKALDISGAVTPVLEALCADAGESTPDLGRVRLVYDWVQYRENFRDVVDVRPILSKPQTAGPDPEPVPVGVREDDLEIAVDVRRGASLPLRELTAERLRAAAEEPVFLEDWGPGRESCIWDFNTLYWSALQIWEKATGKEYEQALPGGQSDARNRDAAGDLIHELFAVWDRLAATGALPDQLYVVELGVGNGNQARVFLDEFRELDRAHGKEYYGRLHYLMCDYSQHVLDLARENVAEHAERVSSLALDATRPGSSLGFLHYKVFLVYISNVYDNLPTDEVAHMGGRSYHVQTRAYLPAEGAVELADAVGASPPDVSGLVRKLLRHGPSALPDAAPAHFADVDAAVRFWQRAWSLVRLKERYVPLSGLDTYPLAPG